MQSPVNIITANVVNTTFSASTWGSCSDFELLDQKFEHTSDGMYELEVADPESLGYQNVEYSDGTINLSMTKHLIGFEFHAPSEH